MYGKLVLLVGGILALGMCLGKITHRLRLTGIVGYLFTGVILGPLIRLGYFGVGEETISGLWEVTTRVTLALIGFIIGGHLTIYIFKRLGKRIVAMVLGESLGAFFLVFFAVYVVSGNFLISLLLAGIAPASAPAGTVAVLHEYRARGPLTSTILAVVGWDDALAVIIFAVALSCVKVGLGGGLTIFSIMNPFREIFGSIILGLTLGGILFFFTKRIRESETLFIVSLASVFVGAGLAEVVGFSFILTCMVMGMVLINLLPVQGKTSLNTIENLMPPLYVLFFTLAGTCLRFDLLLMVGGLGLAYMVGRSLGLIGGATLSARATAAPKTIQKYAGFGLLSQAGVAIGFAALASSELTGYAGGSHIAITVMTLIMATTVVFEIIGPIGIRYAITRAGEAMRE